jgi:hypothetical protein
VKQRGGALIRLPGRPCYPRASRYSMPFVLAVRVAGIPHKSARRPALKLVDVDDFFRSIIIAGSYAL